MKPDKPFSAFYIEEVIRNCDMISDRIAENDMTVESYGRSPLYQDMLTMPMIRICEIIKLYRAEFEKLYSDYDWKSVGAMRDKMAHPYGGFDYSFVWDAAQCDLPHLKEICASLLEN